MITHITDESYCCKVPVFIVKALEFSPIQMLARSKLFKPPHSLPLPVQPMDNKIQSNYSNAD
jgi:hypothetical protein